jgi:integrase/recombinase XerD
VTTCLLDLDLDYLLSRWLRELKGARKSPHTMAGYRAAVRGFLAFCADSDRPAELDRDTVIAYLAAHNGEASTARLHLTVLKLFAKWVAADDPRFDASGVLGIKPPAVDQRPVPHLTDVEIRRLLSACDGSHLLDRRDRALVALLAETGLRAAEMLALNVDDIDLDSASVRVIRGKGGKGRRVRFSDSTAVVVDRYFAARHRSGWPRASGPAWVSHRRNRLTYRGLRHALSERAAAAGVTGFHIHRLRHTMSVRWLRAGGSETGLRAQAGWRSSTMIERYIRTASEELAAEEFDRLALGVTEL